MATSKKDYEAIAAIFADQTTADPTNTNSPEQTMRLVLARQLATYFEQDNPRFDRSRFMRACNFLRAYNV